MTTNQPRSLRVLFLDDAAERHASFISQTCSRVGGPMPAPGISSGISTCFVWSVDQAWDAMQRERFDIAFLDHDLGPEHYAEHRTGLPAGLTGSGTELAERMHFMPHCPPSLVVIHSWNRYGADRMARALRGLCHLAQAPFSDGLVHVGVETYLQRCL